MRTVSLTLGFGLCAAFMSLPAVAGTKPSSLCAGQKPGTFKFYESEPFRDKPLPPSVASLKFSKPMFAVGCFPNAVGPQETGGEKFRVVLYVDGKQTGGVFRPRLSQARTDVIILINEDFGSSLGTSIDPGKHEFRLQAASETPTDTVDVSVNTTTDMAYIQQLRKAGYVADSKVPVIK